MTGALLTSNCTPDRLRRLSVDADECSSHVFRVTEADRFRDAFDRFGSRFYAASGQIGAEPFHHTRWRGASLRPECAAELAQAHANRLRDRKSTRLNSSHSQISYAVFCLKKK